MGCKRKNGHDDHTVAEYASEFSPILFAVLVAENRGGCFAETVENRIEDIGGIGGDRERSYAVNTEPIHESGVEKIKRNGRG